MPFKQTLSFYFSVLPQNTIMFRITSIKRHSRIIFFTKFSFEKISLFNCGKEFSKNSLKTYQFSDFVRYLSDDWKYLLEILVHKTKYILKSSLCTTN